MTVVKIMNRPPSLQSISPDLDDRAAMNNNGQLNHINHQDSSCINPDIKKKIKFSWLSVVFGVGLCIVDRIGDIRAIIQIYLVINNGNYNNSSVHTVEAEPYIITNYQLFLICFSLIITISFYISLKSIAYYWTKFNEITVKKERKKQEKTNFYAKLTYWKSFQDPKSRWTIGRLVLHLLLLAPAARTIELGQLGSKTKSILKENNESKMKKHFDQFKSSHRKLTSIQHEQNCFESGPLLLLKMHLLALHLISSKALISCGFWNLFFVGVGITSCAWKITPNRKYANLINDYEKRMSWFHHTQPLFMSHFLSVCVRFNLLGILSAYLLKMISITKIEGGISFFNVTENVWAKSNDLLWILTKEIFHVWHVLLSSLFNIENFEEKNYKTLRFIIYQVILTCENALHFGWIINAGISLELDLCLNGFLIASLVILHITENNLFHLSRIIAAPTSPYAINPIASVPVENRSNDKDVDSLKP